MTESLGLFWDFEPGATAPVHRPLHVMSHPSKMSAPARPLKRSSEPIWRPAYRLRASGPSRPTATPPLWKGDSACVTGPGRAVRGPSAGIGVPRPGGGAVRAGSGVTRAVVQPSTARKLRAHHLSPPVRAGQAPGRRAHGGDPCRCRLPGPGHPSCRWPGGDTTAPQVQEERPGLVRGDARTPVQGTLLTPYPGRARHRPSEELAGPGPPPPPPRAHERHHPSGQPACCLTSRPWT